MRAASVAVLGLLGPPNNIYRVVRRIPSYPSSTLSVF